MTAWRAATLPMVRRFGSLNALSVANLGSFLRLPGLQESSPLLADANPFGDVGGVRVDRVDSVVHAFGPLLPSRRPRCAKRRHRRRAHPPVPPVQAGLRLRARLPRPRENPCSKRDNRLAAQLRCVQAHYSHNTAILGAIDSIHWLHDCRHSSLVVAVHWERLSRSAVCNHACLW